MPTSYNHAMKDVAKLPRVPNEIKSAFLEIWIQHKHLPLKVGKRRVMASALKVLLPTSNATKPMRLYRGTTAQERRRLYGFSWTQEPDIARNFAKRFGFCDAGGAVVLETIAPAKAIMLIRKKERYYDEGEVIVDPYNLRSIKCIERLTPD